MKKKQPSVTESKQIILLFCSGSIVPVVGIVVGETSCNKSKTKMKKKKTYFLKSV